ncbi:hypothetical protein [Pyrodictium delaneyi]|uniref:Uncharacterized protein n=1 Tax=Pyrodictium delaneyi TaxID=1273541 RepID=A0A211YRE7_9CREN|nr:hypothetical protein [Pyrodictium delaneyi]OWJ55628.1 hypothetical protein Pdsh_02240 [Pyrodictium delaneyi]
MARIYYVFTYPVKDCDGVGKVFDVALRFGARFTTYALSDSVVLEAKSAATAREMARILRSYGFRTKIVRSLMRKA